LVDFLYFLGLEKSSLRIFERSDDPLRNPVSQLPSGILNVLRHPESGRSCDAEIAHKSGKKLALFRAGRQFDCSPCADYLAGIIFGHPKKLCCQRFDEVFATSEVFVRVSPTFCLARAALDCFIGARDEHV